MAHFYQPNATFSAILNIVKTLLVIFGITGDLAGRKLLPALDSIVKSGEEDLGILGISRRQVSVGELLGDYPRLAPLSDVMTMDLAELSEYARLKKHLETVPADTVLFYLSVPPGAAADIVDFLGQAGLNSPRYRVLFEKPFGYDLASAEEFIERTGQYFKEEQLYRIDHYMAKDIAADIVSLRQNAENYHHHWSNESVKEVTIIASETIGIEGRGHFYEQTGALRDFVQGHLMQLLSLVLMDASSFSIDRLAERRLAALEQLNPVNPEETVRAQYEGYGEEAGNTGSRTETFVGLTLESNDPRWRGVPIHLITGKALDEKRSAIIVTYTDGTQDVFEEGATADGRPRKDAYERVLCEAMNGGRAIFTTSDEIVRSWQLLAPLQEAWEMERVPLETYKKGAPLTHTSLVK